MASEKNPSIYYDRSTIGSLDELDEYGVWVKSEPQDLSSANADTQGIMAEGDLSELTGDLPNFDDFEAESWPADISSDMEDLADFNLSMADNSDSLDDTFDLKLDSEADDANLPGGGLSLPASDADLPRDDLVYRKGSLSSLLDEDTPVIEDLPRGDLVYQKGSLESLLEPEPEKTVPAPSREAAGETGAAGELSTQLLMRIAEELSAIKSELSSLKNELQDVKKSADEAVPEEQSGGGFFDEEDDEKIALTGDELNNILNTADFTEETGADAQEEIFDTDSLNLPETEDETALDTDSFPDFKETASGDLPVLDENLDIPAGNVEIPPELEELQVEGVEPMTSVTEDTSFLEEDPLVSGADELDDAVIEEPDLSGELKENPIVEPSLDDFSIELDTEEAAAGETGTEDLSTDLSTENEISLDNGGLEEIELNLDDSDDLSSLESDPFGETDLEEMPDAIGDNLDDDTYDQVIPEGFLVESEDGQPGEEIPGSGEIPENAEDPLVLDGEFDALEDAPIADALPVAEEEALAEGFDAVEELSVDDTGVSDAGEIPLPVEAADTRAAVDVSAIPEGVKAELRSVLSYMDQLLESLPEDKIEEFAKSEQFDTYKKLFAELGLV
jgi:hypothetical protein